ncbi:MAG: hypothetical protein K5644_01730 [Lachnospiraceae bacterium]|nr:hypothetical protein [Lachnospiraceae bacterium]
MGNLVEKKGFWITLAVLGVLMVGALIFSIVMIVKFGEPGEQQQQNTTEEKTVGVKPNNSFLVFCNNDSLYALDANYASNPVVTLRVAKGDSVNEITDAAQIQAIWDSMKAMKIADASATAVTPAEYTLTFHRNTGSDVTVTFQSPTLLTFDGANYDIADSAGLFDKL